MKFTAAQRIAAVQPSATLAVDARAKQLAAEGARVINFSAGEPDFPTPPHIVEAARTAAGDPANHRYSSTPGLPALREAVAAAMSSRAQVEIRPSNVVITNGGKQAVFQAALASLNPGDHVLIPTPYWTTYPEAVRLAGAVPVPVATRADNGFLVLPEQLEEARSPRTAMVIICSPSNPTGSVYSAEQLRALGEWAVRADVLVLADEIYEHLYYDGRPASIISAAPEVADRCLIVNGVSKAYAMTGWRVGWLVVPDAAASAVATLQSHLTSNVSNISQMAALAALTGDQGPREAMRTVFAARRNQILDAVRCTPGMRCVVAPGGAFYVFADVSEILQSQHSRLSAPEVADAVHLARVLLDDCHVATVAGEAFGVPGYLRFSYALHDDDIAEGFRRLQKWIAG